MTLIGKLVAVLVQLAVASMLFAFTAVVITVAWEFTGSEAPRDWFLFACTAFVMVLVMPPKFQHRYVPTDSNGTTYDIPKTNAA